MIEQVVAAIKLGASHNRILSCRSTPDAFQGDVAYIVEHAASVKLIDGVYDPGNLFCLNLPSGALGMGRLTPQNFLSSGRTNEYYLESLIVDDETFFRCGANPRTLISSAINSMNFSHYHPDAVLRAFDLDEQKTILRHHELLEIVQQIGGDSVVVLMQSVLDSEQTFFVTESSAAKLISCVYSLLPARARKNLTVAAGLYFGEERSTRLIGVVKKANAPLRSADCRKIESFLDLRDVKKNSEMYVVDNAWAALVQAVLVSEYVRFFFYGKLVEEMVSQQDEFDEEFSDLRLEDVAEVGREWLEELENGVDENESTIDFSDFGSDEEGEEWKQAGENDAADSEEVVNDSWKPSSWEDETSGVPKRNRFLDDMKSFSTQIEDDVAKIAGQSPERSAGDEARPQRPTGFPDDSIETSLMEILGVIDGAFHSQGNDVDPDDSNSVRDVELRLSPFVLLSGAFPKLDRDLRTLHALIGATVKGGGHAEDVEKLEAFWRPFCSRISADEILKIRESYLEFLTRTITLLKRKSTVECVEKIVGCNEVVDVLTREEEDSSES
ncbi:MAG: hypothetical protein IK077_15015 [Thermoguttaceae bacterium]|nr:hypothetical protein [Thermoguttaceae bacterium]